jgi:hypothetical protein
MSRLRQLVRADQALVARLLVHLGEVDARGLYREHAFQSMFAYAVEELHMSEAEAYLRIQVARLGREYPLVLRMLAKGELHLTAIKLLGPHLKPDNHARVLARAKFKGKRDIELLVAELAPKPDVPSVVRKLPERTPTRTTNLALPQPREGDRVPSAPPPVVPLAGDYVRAPLSQASLTSTMGSGNRVASSQSLIASIAADGDRTSDRDAMAQQPVAMVRDRDPGEGDRDAFQLKAPTARVSSTTPLRPGRYEVKFTAGQAMQDKLERLKNLLRHQVPGGDIGIILERAADLLLEKTMKERFAQGTRRRTVVPPSEATGGSSSQRIAATTDGQRIAAAESSEPTRERSAQLTAAPTNSDRRGETKACGVASGVRRTHAHSRYVPRSWFARCTSEMASGARS